MSRAWNSLPLHDRSYPRLFFSYEPSPEGYGIYLTDLAHVWLENLSYRQIINRASKEETSIDPSQDRDQYTVLLQKVEDALQGSEGSSISLSSSGSGFNLTLVTTTTLPKPLEPLEWTLKLTRLPPSGSTRHLLLPALRRESGYQGRQRSLVELLKEKDKIIGKLFDKIETSGLDLSTVFPGMASVRPGQKRGSLYSQASVRVKGVNPFDEEMLAGKSSEINQNVVEKDSLKNSIYDYDLSGPQNLELIDNEWWKNPITSSGQRRSEKPTLVNNSEPVVVRGDNKKEDEFQRQETPPRLKATETGSLAEEQEDTSEASSSEHYKNVHAQPAKNAKDSKKVGLIGKPKSNKQTHAKPQNSNASDTSEVQRSQEGKKKGLGSIGGKGSKTSSRRPDLDSTTTPRKKKGTDNHKVSHAEGQATASEAEDEEHDAGGDDEDFSKPVTRFEDPQHNTIVDQGATTERQQSQDDKPISTRKRGGVLGQIGGKKQKVALSHRDAGRPNQVVSLEHEADNAKGNAQNDTEQKTSSSKQQIPGSSHGHVEQSSPEPVTQSSASKTSKRSGKLGTIGGVRNSQKSAKTDDTKVEVDSKRTLGLASQADGDREDNTNINRKEHDSTRRSPPLQDNSRRAQETKEEPESDKEETLEERADRKRQELRRQLERVDQGLAKPAKKKRRF